MRQHLPVLILLAAASACVPKHIKETQAATEAQVTLMATRQAVLEESLEASEEKLEQAQATLRVIGRDKGDLLEALDDASDQLRSLRGEIETLRFDLDELREQQAQYVAQQEARQLHDELRLKQIESALGLKPPPRPEVDTSGLEGIGQGGDTDTDNPDADPGTEDLPPTARGKLERAVQEMRDGRQGVARFLLEKAIDEHAGDPVLDEVRYRLGETWANEGKWNKAALAFNEVIDNHPKSQWAAWSMLRQGESFLQMGDKDGAIIFFEETVRLYPRSEAAAEARKQIKGL